MTRPPRSSAPAGRTETRRRPARPGSTPSGRLRLFYAVIVPDEARAELAAAQKNLHGKYWKAVSLDQLHVTLHFMPAVAAKGLPEIVRAGEQVAARTPAFTAALRGTGFFPNEGSPRVWFARVDGSGFQPLAVGLAKAIPLGEQEPDTEFRSHVTLARKKGPAGRPNPVVFNHSWPVTEIALVRSTLQPSGPTYETIERMPLAPAPPEEA